MEEGFNKFPDFFLTKDNINKAKRQRADGEKIQTM